MTEVERNVAIFHRWYEELWVKRNLPALAEFVPEDYDDHDPFPGQITGRAGLANAYTMLWTAFPDITFTVLDMIASGDRIVVRSMLRGTHNGEFMGLAPTGKAVEFSAIDIIRFVDGICVEGWANVDMFHLLKQLGAIPEIGGKVNKS